MTTEKVSVTVRLDPDTISFLDNLAELQDRDRSYLIKQAVSNFLDEEYYAALRIRRAYARLGSLTRPTLPRGYRLVQDQQQARRTYRFGRLGGQECRLNQINAFVWYTGGSFAVRQFACERRAH